MIGKQNKAGKDNWEQNAERKRTNQNMTNPFPAQYKPIPQLSSSNQDFTGTRKGKIEKYSSKPSNQQILEDLQKKISSSFMARSNEDIRQTIKDRLKFKPNAMVQK
jgi:hypothetical protein